MPRSMVEHPFKPLRTYFQPESDLYRSITFPSATPHS